MMKTVCQKAETLSLLEQLIMQELLGHSDVITTINVYARAIREAKSSFPSTRYIPYSEWK